MNTQITIDYLQRFADAIRVYLRYNTEYRQTRNPQRKTILRDTRANAYRQAQEANNTLHTHLLAYETQSFITLQARELIRRWDARNTAFENLASSQNNGDWHERPADKITRLDRAEKNLRQHLTAITEIISKLTSIQ